MAQGTYDFIGTDENDIFIAGDNVDEGTEGAAVYTFGENTYNVLLTDENALISGLSGSDTLVGGNGNDIISAGAGNDYLIGNAGSNIYVFQEGDGYNTIVDANSSDTIKFLSREDFSGITFKRGDDELGESETSLYIRYSEVEGDIIEVQGYFESNDTPKDNHINTFNVNDTDYTLEWSYVEQNGNYSMFNIPDDENDVVEGIGNWIQISESDLETSGLAGNDMLIGTSGDDIINGLAGDDVILGQEGQDRLFGNNGDDIIFGGRGNDDLTGGDGNNTFIFKIGDGTDVIYDAKKGDTIKFLDVEFKDLKFEKTQVLDENDEVIEDVYNLKITYGNSENSDIILIKNFSFNVNSLNNNNIDNIVALNKGVETNYSILNDALITIPNLTGSIYSEVITGTDKNNAINLGGGSDSVTGGDGRNTFVVINPNAEGAVSGHSVIEDAKADDTIKFTGTKFEDLSFVINSNSKDLVISNGEDNSVTVKNFLTGQKYFDKLLVLNDNPEAITEYMTKYISDDAQIQVFMDSGSTYYRGTFLNETITSTASDESFSMGRGSNKIRILTDNLFGDDTVHLTRDEKLNIEFLETVDGNLVYDFGFNATVKGNDVVFYHDKGSLTIKNVLINDVGAQLYVNDADIKKRPLIKFDETNVNKKGVIQGSVLADFINLENFVSRNGIKGVKVISGPGDDTVDGSSYNDTIIGAYGNNLIYEDGGKNKITTGAGNDTITASGYSFNTIKTGSGENIINLQSVGTNKVTAGDDKDVLNILSGTNTVNLLGGENIVNAEGVNSVNKITTGNSQDTFNIKAGVNTVKSGKGGDIFNIEGGYNNITAKAGDREKPLFTISGGINNIKGSTGNDKFIIKDAIYIDEEEIEQHTYGGKNYINGGKGSDLYVVDEPVYKNSFTRITDTSGTNTLVLNEKLDVYFAVKLNKKTGKYKIGKTVAFTDGFDSDGDGKFDINSLNTGISFSGKNAKAVSYVIVDVDNSEGEKDYKYKFDVSKLASDVASWLSTSRFSSTADVLDYGNKDEIHSLLSVYKGDNGQTDYGSGQCYRNGVDVTPYV